MTEPELPTQAGPDDGIRRLVDAARDVWIRRLIDPSRANSLLFYRDLKVGTLDLGGQPEAVRRLLNGQTTDADDLVPAATTPSSTEPSSPRGDSASVAPRDRVLRALVAIQRKALSNLEEKGIETLFLALGMARWPATDGGRPYDAPVLLLPARIETRGRGVSEDLRLSVDGEPRINPVLVFVLAESFGVRLDPDDTLQGSVTESDNGKWTIDPEPVFERLAASAAAIKGFAVARRVVLGNFQFAKMAMVEDIRRNGDAMAASALIGAMAGHEGSRRRLSAAVNETAPAALDERPIATDYLVLDADSTQHRAIVLVCQGQNGVVQGPPGTGKSQTIANLIAQSVAEGKRVLFVAEKRAALEAVVKRLNHPAVGLGHLVLDLHGASVSRKEVMARLATALEQIRHAQAPGDVDAVHREYEARRRQLNEHAHRVHARRQPAGLSVFELLGRLLRLPEEARSRLRLRGAALGALSPERFGELRQRLQEGAARPTLLLGTDPSPWNDAEIRDGRAAQQLLDEVARISDTLWPRFEQALAAVCEQVSLATPQSLDAVGDLLGVLRDASRLGEHYDARIFASSPSELAVGLQPGSLGVLGRFWAFVTDGRFREARRRARSLRRQPAPAAELLQDAQLAADLLSRWQALGGAGGPPLDVGTAPELSAAWSEVREALAPIERAVPGGPFGGVPLEVVRERIHALGSDRLTPYRLPEIHAIRDVVRNAGLEPLLGDLRQHGTAPQHWTARLEHVWLHSTLEEALAADPALAAFSGSAHDDLVAEFSKLDRELLRLAADRVRRLAAERAIRAMDEHFDQADLVQREARKRSRHVPLRELFARAPDVLTRIAPCWIASPLSVSQLLDPSSRHFDLVVFDEASQVLQEEAVPALYRAGQVVVAGDRHQLPPTTFFATAIEGEDEISEEDESSRRAAATATAAIGGFESLLDTLGAFLPNWMLEWHYRSEDERLIAFSNEHIYRRQLVTFPGARGLDAIQHVLVPHDPALGSQEESASREVGEIVRLVLEHARSRPDESLGVITMGIKHANRVQAALDRALSSEPLDSGRELGDFFSLDREERFFVKNLETVQGDERDAILLSVGYGKSANGDLPHRFGPLTQDTGHRRLNVAVTRARRRMTVVSSFSHQEIDLGRSGSRGVQLLKAYLEFAASGGTRLPESESAGDVPPNPFEADVQDALEARGIRTRAQFGASRFRIDLVAMHPVKPGRPILAIECDGATYHSGATARDRDRLRQAHLMRLGWQFHRIWSTDWFHNREEEVQRVVAAFEDAVRSADQADEDSRQGMPDTQPGQSGSSASTETETEPQPIAAGERGPRPVVPDRESIDEYRESELRELFAWVASDGLLRTQEQLVREVFELLPFARLGTRIRARLEATAGRRARVQRYQ